MNRRRLEAEAVRDACWPSPDGSTSTMGGPGFQDFVVEHPEHSPHYEYHLLDPEDPPGASPIDLPLPGPLAAAAVHDGARLRRPVDERGQAQRSTDRAPGAGPAQRPASWWRWPKHFAERARGEPRRPPSRIDRGVSRWPSAASRRSRDARRWSTKAAQASAWPNACRVILNLNEFVFVD